MKTGAAVITDRLAKTLLALLLMLNAAALTAEAAIQSGGDWMEKHSPQSFTLQLLATRNSEGIARFVRQKGLVGPLVHFVVELKGREMHLLTRGSYTTHAEAERAAKTLPAGIRPWIRRLAGIQKVMIGKSTQSSQIGSVASLQEGGVKDMPWLWSQDPQTYTIQLAAARSREAAEEMINGLVLPGERMVLRTVVNDSPWYTLIYGRFADEASARATIGRLPKKLQQAEPWPRRFASLHDEIRQVMSGQ